jgi:alpha-L-rhamnosidase
MHPRLQWIVESSRRSERQTAYRILVSSSPSLLSQDHGDEWDTGKVTSDATNQIAYEGKTLHAGKPYFWKVQTWDNNDATSWSTPAHWSMGLLTPGDWKAKCIGDDSAYIAPEVADKAKHGLNLTKESWLSFPNGVSSQDNTLYLRKTFDLPTVGQLSRAVLVLSCDNEITAEINGKSVGQAYRWESTALLDASAALRPGGNVIALKVHNTDFLNPDVIGKLVLIYQTGPDVVIDLDDTSKVSASADAGWDANGFDDSAWAAAAHVDPQYSTLADKLRTPVPYLRKTFTISKPVSRATIYITALGLYDLHLNGQRVGQSYFAPGWTDFRKRVHYQTYDVTSQVHTGTNAVGALLGDGWYAGCLAFTGKRNWYGGTPRLLAQLVVEHPDGTCDTIATDTTWKAGIGPIKQADLLMGDVYDDRDQLTGWDSPGFNDSSWRNASDAPNSLSAIGADVTLTIKDALVNNSVSLLITNDAMGGDPAYNTVKSLHVVYAIGSVRRTADVAENSTLSLTGAGDARLTIIKAVYGPQSSAPAGPLLVQADPAEPVRIINTLPAIKLTEPKPGLYTFDIGQNMVGWARLKLSGSPGQKIVVRHGEMLNPDGTVYLANLRGATGADIYYLRGHGLETLEPYFTLKGFRYVEIRGLTQKPSLDTVTGVVVHSDMVRTGSFDSSNPSINQLYHNIIWGQKGNYLAVPTDCPQRDERAGWTGDTEFFMPTAAYNFDISSFFTSWLVTMCDDSQYPDGSFAHVSPDLELGSGATAWGDAALQCTYHMYQVYGDTQIIKDHYSELAHYMDFLNAHSSNYIAHVGGFEDWLNLGGGADNDVIDTAYYAYLAGIMSDMAQAIGKTDDAAKYRQLHDKVRDAFDSAFIQPDGSIKNSSQTAYALAFTMNLVPDAKKAAVAGQYVGQLQKFNWHLATGFIGTPRLLPGLHEAGKDDAAYKILMQDTYPGWLFQVKLGATTMWERWDGWTPDKGFQSISMNSFNHYSFGAVGQYLYADVAGINSDSPGYRHIVIQPELGGGLTHASAAYDAITGHISSSWKLTGNNLNMDVTIPANTTATVYVPSTDGNVTEGGVSAAKAAGVEYVRRDGNSSVYTIGSGTYSFSTTAP